MMRWFCILITGLLLCFVIAGCGEEPTAKPAPKKPKAAAKVPVTAPAPVQDVKVAEPEVKEKYVYNVEGRRDPFMPLTEVKSPFMDTEEPMTPLQAFDVNQYRLIAVIIGKDAPRAMVVSPDGKSYILKIGMRIGKNEGVIIDINQEAILIEEKYYDFSGDVRTNIQEIPVPKRGGA